MFSLLTIDNRLHHLHYTKYTKVNFCGLTTDCSNMEIVPKLIYVLITEWFIPNTQIIPIFTYMDKQLQNAPPTIHKLHIATDAVYISYYQYTSYNIVYFNSLGIIPFTINTQIAMDTCTLYRAILKILSVCSNPTQAFQTG